MRLWDLCIHIDADAGFQFDGDVIIPDGDLFDPASHQRFVKFGEVGSLLCDIILQVVDSLYLLIPCGGIDCGLPAEFTETENLVGILIVVWIDFRYMISIRNYRAMLRRSLC